MKPNDNLFVGMMIGATIPVVGYVLIENLVALIHSMGYLETVSLGIAEKRLRTLALLGICFNIIPLQYLRKKGYDALLRGIMIVTLVYCLAWVYHFRHGLLF